MKLTRAGACILEQISESSIAESFQETFSSVIERSVFHLFCYLNLDFGGKNLLSKDEITPALQRDSSGYRTLHAQRRMRTRFNRAQSTQLEREFLRNPYPGVQGRITLAGKLEIDEPRIKVRIEY